MELLQCFKKSALDVDLSSPWFWISVFSIAFNPFFWNVVARREYKTKVITKFFKGNRYSGCYALAAVIQTLGAIRFLTFEKAMLHQPKAECFQMLFTQVAAYVFFVVGFTLVMASFSPSESPGHSLVKTKTRSTPMRMLGDYFGILMDARVISFPFNVNDDPMYNGTALMSLGTALWSSSPAGIYLSGFVHLVYRIALAFEGPFTSEIYRKRDESRKAGPRDS
ncbi:phospholipid methyltransferase [Linnemannia elongata AG-77]|uniref:Phosphatidyl-N-methylethanolamine N-methyltransferase n=1 Tax=Linnemannia elongata AG-77 TaxID=1314771 RepID=A0A197JXG4_9FUNG|nr:phospholipid methyltransferase [Linnemannia elongata AG-77]